LSCLLLLLPLLLLLLQAVLSQAALLAEVRDLVQQAEVPEEYLVQVRQCSMLFLDNSRASTPGCSSCCGCACLQGG
jgi:hypothetical protein